MPSAKLFLLLYGATGATGKIVVEDLIQSGTFRLGVISRSTSSSLLEKWQSQGVALRTVDVSSASPEALEEVLVGVDYLVSFCSALALETQRPLLAAAKRAGVRRVVPSDFGPATPPGATHFQDIKLGIREYVRTLGLPYTFIDIGWWMELTLPYPRDATVAGPPMITNMRRRLYGAGDVKSAVTDSARLAELLTRVLLDSRTENQAVFCWEDEVTQNDIWAIAAREANERAEILDTRVLVPVEQLHRDLAAAKAAYDKNPSLENLVSMQMLLYPNVLYVRGDNTVANAVAAGALDAQELYPDFIPRSLAEFAKGWYRSPTPFPYEV